MTIIEKYEFVIAVLIKTVSFKNIQFDKPYNIIVDNICNRIDYYIKEYFKNDDDKSIFDIIRFIDFQKKKGSIPINNAVSLFCKTWNDYYHWIFNRKKNDITETLSVNNIENITTFNELCNNYNIPQINYDAIYNLLVFFENKKNELKERPVNKINPKTIVDDPNKETVNQKAKTNNPDDLRNKWLGWRSDCFIVNKSSGEYEIPRRKASKFIDMCFQMGELKEKEEREPDSFSSLWLFDNVNVIECRKATIDEYIERHKEIKKNKKTIKKR